MPSPGENIQDWSTTAANNANADSSIGWAEGQSRASVNDSARSMMAAHAKKRNLENGSIVTGNTANAQTFFSGLDYTTVPTGLRVLLKIGPNLTNTAAATLNMDNIGAVAIKTMAATDLIGGELVAGAYAEFIYNGTNWIWLAPRSGVQLISTQTASGTPATIDFVTGIDASYDEHQVTITNAVPATDGMNLLMQIGFGTPPVFQTAASYRWLLTVNQNGVLTSTDQTTTSFALTAAQSSNPAVPASGRVTLPSLAGTFLKFPRWETAALNNNTGAIQLINGTGTYLASGLPITGLRFMFTAGLITSGKFSLYGARS